MNVGKKELPDAYLYSVEIYALLGLYTKQQADRLFACFPNGAAT